MTYARKINSRPTSKNGFTIVELLVVISISMFVIIPSIVGYTSYTNSQNVNNAALDIKNLLIVAQQRALSEVQTNIAACNAPTSGLVDYEVHFCTNGTNACANSDNYELYVKCLNVAALQHISNSTNKTENYDKKFPGNVTWISQPANPIIFEALTGKVTNPTTIVIKGGSVTKTITVQPNGVISIQ